MAYTLLLLHGCPQTSRHQFKLNFHLPEDEHENEALGLWYAAQTLGNLRPELV